MRGKRLTASDRKNLLDRYVAGEDYQKLAAEFKVHESYPRALAQRSGLTWTRINGRRSRIAKETRRSAVESYRRGERAIDIAKRLGVSPGLVTGWALEDGCTPHSKWGSPRYHRRSP